MVRMGRRTQSEEEQRKEDKREGGKEHKRKAEAWETQNQQIQFLHLLSPNGNQTGIKRETREKHEKHTERYGKHTGNIREVHGKHEGDAATMRPLCGR